MISIQYLLLIYPNLSSKIQIQTLDGSFDLRNFEYLRVTKILDVISIGLFWLGLNLIFLLFPIFSGFELIKRSTSTIFSILTYIVGLSYQLWRLSNYQSLKYNFIQRVNLVIKQFKVFLRLQLLIYLLAAWTLPFIFDKICICSYNTEYGIPLIMDTQFSTQDIEARGQRRIYACLFQNLTSGSDYKVSVYHYDKILKRTTYRTISSREDNNQLKILFGGDFGLQKQGRKLASKVINVDPHIIIIGGDVSYDNGHIHCYYSNDLFLNIFEEQFEQMGRVVPFILSVGNHDVGFSDYANYNITVSDEKGPLYLTLFPQKQVNGVIPDIKNRVTYNYHLIQNILLFGLDSGFLYSHEQQVPFVKNISEQYPNFARMAHFHVPLYPSCFSNASSMEHWENLVYLYKFYQRYAQKHWVPLFAELNFKAVFENHVHQYKRTYPLRQGQISEFGTIYFGDGSMGVTVDQCEEQYQTFQKGGVFEGLFETVLTENSEHFWVLNCDKYGRVKYEARNPNYNVIPNSQTEQNLFVSHDL